MKRKITVNINSTYKYLQLWNGIFNLTNKELEILSIFIDVQAETKEDSIGGVVNKKEVAKKMEIVDYNTLNNYIKKFKDKGVIRKNGNNYSLNQFLNPNTKLVEITIKK